jgi:hypothetical protein
MAMGRKSKKAGKAFDLDDPELPEWVEDGALTSGGYPYDKRLGREEYEQDLKRPQIELLKRGGRGDVPPHAYIRQSVDRVSRHRQAPDAA